MKDKHDIYFFIGIGLTLYLYLRPKTVANPQPEDPGFVGPVQSPYIPTVIGGVPVQLPATIQNISCNDPNMDPVMCQILQSMQY